MTIFVRVVIAAVIGGVVGAVAGNAAQSRLIFSIYWGADHITRQYSISGLMCLCLGVATATAFVLWNAKYFKAATWICLSASVLCLFWLGADGDSQFYHWWSFFSYSTYQVSFPYRNAEYYSLRELLANGLIFNGIPLLWSISLLWIGLKSFCHRKSFQQTT